MTIAAGDPIPPDTKVGELLGVKESGLPENAIPRTHGVLRVKGRSMIEADITSGDYVLVRYDEEPKSNVIMALWLQEQEGVTLKRMRMQRGVWYAYWEDGSNKKVMLTADDRVLGEFIQKVKRVMRK